MTVDIDDIKSRIAYNAHDLGEMGKMIRVDYVYNILDDLAPQLITQAEKDRALSNTERDLGLLRARIHVAIQKCPYDFCTADKLEEKLGVPRDILLPELAALERAGEIRRPIDPNGRYDEWYRDVNRGLTRQEKWLRLIALITFQRLRGNY